MSFDPRALRDVFGCFTTGVTVITANPADGPVLGVTANSFSSVSLDPPLVLWCLGKESDTLPVFEATPHYAINFLAADQQELSNHCAKRGDHSLDCAELAVATTGAPIIKGAIASLDCEVADRIDAGDHIIMLGRVVDIVIQDIDRAPLVFSRGQYRDLA